MRARDREATTLAALLRRHTSEIAAEFAEAVRRLANSRYWQRSADELKASISRATAALAEALDTDSREKIETYLGELRDQRLAQGFDIGEVIEALLVWRETTLDFVRRSFPADSEQAAQANRTVDEYMRPMIGRFGHLYARAMQSDLEEQQTRIRQQAEELAVLEERQRLARELHDSVTQSLFSIALYAEAAARHLASGDGMVSAGHLRELRATAQEAMKEMRLLIFELRPSILEQQGLASALQLRLDQVEARAGIQARLSVAGEAKLAPAVEAELYRIAHEALNNALKHAQAGHVVVGLSFGADEVCLRVEDDGVGFDAVATTRGRGLGLHGMAERAQRIGGHLTVSELPRGGTVVQVTVQARPQQVQEG